MDNGANFVNDMPIDVYENASLQLMYAMTSGDFDDFEKLLDENIRTTISSLST